MTPTTTIALVVAATTGAGVVALAVRYGRVRGALWGLLRALRWLAWRLTLVALTLAVLPLSRRWAWGMLRRVVPRSSAPGRQEGRGNAERGTGIVPVAKLRPVSAQKVATSAVSAQRYGVYGVGGPGMLTEVVAAPGMGKTMLKLGTWRSQYDGRDFCGLDTTRGGRKLMLTEMPPALMHDFLRAWGFLIEPHGWYDRVRFAVWTPRGSAGWYVDVEYASKVFAPDAGGLVTDWPAVVRVLRRDAVRRYDEVCIDSLMEWLGSTSNDAASEALGQCSHLAGEGLAVSVLHHTPLSDPTRQLGGSGVTRAPDAIWSLYGAGPGGKKRSLKDPERLLECKKLRRQEDAPDAPLRIVYEPADPDGGRPLPRYRLAGEAPAPVDRGRQGGPDSRPSPAPSPRLTERQQQVYQVLRATPSGAATTPDLSTATGLDADRVRDTLKALARLGLVLPAGTAAPHARGSKPPTRWRAVEEAVAVPVADRLLHEALGVSDADADGPPPSHRGAGGLV